jgi:hypothetical protein
LAGVSQCVIPNEILLTSNIGGGESVLEAYPTKLNILTAVVVVEHSLGWLTKRRSLRVRWGKKVGNWLAFIQFGIAHREVIKTQRTHLMKRIFQTS